MKTPIAKEPLKNYITPAGLQRLRDELGFLLIRERPAVTAVVTWAAGNGDRSENADYQYGKRRLRQIDGRIRFLTKRIDAAQVVDPESPRSGRAAAQVFFGATVRYIDGAGVEQVVSIVGGDEVDLDRRQISWLSPLARALDEVRARRPRRAARPRRFRGAADPRGALRAHSCAALHRAARSRVRHESASAQRPLAWSSTPTHSATST